MGLNIYAAFSARALLAYMKRHHHVSAGLVHADTGWVATQDDCHCRWNAAEHGAGSVHLELLPMLLGFFTYKAGVAGRGIFELLRGLRESGRSTQEEAADLAG